MKLHSSHGNPSVYVTTDASGTWGCGASWQDQWIAVGCGLIVSGDRYM